jgi:hypothetical protein
MYPTVSWKLGHAASVSFSCAECGVTFGFYGEGGGPYLHGVIEGLLLEHAGHPFDMIEHSADVLDQGTIDRVLKRHPE